MTDDDVRDELPEDLDVTRFVGPYQFPDVARRRISGVILLVIAMALALLWFAYREGGVLVNRGYLVAAAGLGILAGYHFLAGWRLRVREIDALVAATAEAGFPVGHASAQLGWRGLRSRPTWRILLYSAEDPPARRGLVLVDGLDASVLGSYLEDNPENPDDWNATPTP